MASMVGEGLEPVNRPLTVRERELIDWLIDHREHGDGGKLRSQIEALTVCERCTCGCPTVYFAYRGVPVPRKGERLVSDYLATVDEKLVGVMLFQTDDVLSSLEVYSASGEHATPFGLPEIGTLRRLE